MERYSPGAVWSILMDGSDDPDEVIDVQVGLGRLPIEEQTFLKLLQQGQTVSYAMQELGLKGNQTRIKRQVVQHLTDIING